ncbi:hypothetical protein GCM10025777_37540 [Membranihabitans marinus]|uniref:DUF4398 domain-containing protein n=1 Tax=Nesterenkonia rhizosphaerae TaxID=1348272 RepID=A0ABP9G0T3_9MICC
MATTGNPLYPDSEATLLAYAVARADLRDAVERAEYLPDDQRLSDARDKAEQIYLQAMKRAAATAEGRNHLNRELRAAQQELEQSVAPGIDLAQLKQRQNLRLASGIASSHPKAISWGESYQRISEALASQGYGAGSTVVPGSEALQEIANWGEHDVRFLIGPSREPITRTLINVSEDSLAFHVRAQGSLRSHTAYIRIQPGQVMYRDARGNYLTAQAHTQGGLPYAIYSPKES